MKYFTNCHTLDDLKKAYRHLAMENHPDRGGDLETMKAINAEYEAAFILLKSSQNAAASAETSGVKWTTETPREFIEIVSRLISIPGLEIELCGSWLWISGETYSHRAELKAAGCRWSSSKKMWYWRHSEDAEYRSRGKASMGEIREKYGSEKLAFNPSLRFANA